MKYASTLPATALMAVALITTLIHYSVLPPGLEILEGLKASFDDYFYVLIFLIILLEAIVYVGFYFPGQFFAVVLVILSKPSLLDIVLLTLAMVAAATVGSVINFFIGRANQSESSNDNNTVKTQSLLLAMIHINSLAFFMLSQGAKGRSIQVVWLAGLLNLPYYLALIAATALLSEEIMQIAESTWLVAAILSVWLAIAVYLDIKHHSRRQK